MRGLLVNSNHSHASDQCNEEALSIHRSCTELNKQIKEMEAEQSRNIVPHTVQQQEALEPVETFVLTYQALIEQSLVQQTGNDAA